MMAHFFQAFMNTSAQADCAAFSCSAANSANIVLILDASLLLASIIILSLNLLGLNTQTCRIPE